MKFNGGLHYAGKPEVLKTQFYLIQKKLFIRELWANVTIFFMNISLKDFLKIYP